MKGMLKSVGLLLTGLTMGIYGFWMHIKLVRFAAEHTNLVTGEGRYNAAFDATGGANFVLNLKGMLLTAVTLGIYAPWFIVNLVRFHTDHTTWSPAEAATQLESGAVAELAAAS